MDARNQQIGVLLNSGMTKKTEIAEVLGYANHSAISKRLARIRRTAEVYFDETWVPGRPNGTTWTWRGTSGSRRRSTAR
ncbi:hypothetical protein [Streptomyces collinus]|uniref:hypothetical protein n=1 Tax=Streptomyces collinus TaxID=42684 RepID=UPI00294237E2|nr:hypothetical protein [Streptomyces collinus]